MTKTCQRVSAALLSVLLLCMFTFGASAAATLNVGVKFWKERSDKESMANSGIDTDRDASLTRDVNYTGAVTGEVSKGTGVLTIKNLPASVLTGDDVNKSLTVTCNIQMDLSVLGEINTSARMCIWNK